MSDLVEKVARALARRGLSVNQVFYGGQRLDAELKPHTEDALWPYYKDQAIAAIEALAETAAPCGVCGCAVYPGLPAKLS